VRHWALKRFAAIDDYMAVLRSIALGLVEHRVATAKSDGVGGSVGHRLTEPSL
jgi:hypothetical protein